MKTLLEKWFVKNAPDFDRFPDPRVDYVDRYRSLKNWLNTNCYTFIGAKISSESNGIYTDHGPEHFDQVIRSVGELLGLTNSSSHIPLDCYEVYMLLSGVLLHDAGNIFGREGHEKKAFEILQDVGDNSATCNIERRHIANIAEVHGGRSKFGDKDTINAKFNTESYDYLNAKFRPKLISAIVRFADEICENKTRTSSYTINKNLIPKQSEVYHYYANAISASKVDIEGRQVRLTFDITLDLIDKKLGKDDTEVYLIDEIFNRIEKMNCERLYCSRFFQGSIYLDSIRVTINIKDKNYEDVDTLLIDTHTGYPSESLNLARKYTSWSGEALKTRFEEGCHHD